MPNLEEVYARLQSTKKKRSELNKMLKDELTHNDRHREIIEEIRILREEKKTIEIETANSVYKDHEYDDLKSDIQTDNELLSDIALNMYVKNQTVEIVDEYDQKWHPEFKVIFKKGY